VATYKFNSWDVADDCLKMPVDGRKGLFFILIMPHTEDAEMYLFINYIMSEGFVYVFILKSTSPHGFMAW
jgi:hypothetical protein